MCVLSLSQNGYTALHIAAKKNQMDIVSTLVEHGARTSAESRVRFCSVMYDIGLLSYSCYTSQEINFHPLLLYKVQYSFLSLYLSLSVCMHIFNVFKLTLLNSVVANIILNHIKFP